MCRNHRGNGVDWLVDDPCLKSLFFLGGQGWIYLDSLTRCHTEENDDDDDDDDNNNNNKNNNSNNNNNNNNNNNIIIIIIIII